MIFYEIMKKKISFHRHFKLANLFAGGSAKMLPNRSKDGYSVSSSDN